MEAMRDLLKNSLGQSLNSLSDDDKLAAAWPVACGKTMAERAMVIGYDRGVLRVWVENRMWLQQLMTMRTPAAYAGVSAWARRQTGDAAGAAYLGLGRAYLLDKRYSDATANLRMVKQNSEVLSDYADYLAAEALAQLPDALRLSGHPAAA